MSECWRTYIAVAFELDHGVSHDAQTQWDGGKKGKLEAREAQQVNLRLKREFKRKGMLGVIR